MTISSPRRSLADISSEIANQMRSRVNTAGRDRAIQECYAIAEGAVQVLLEEAGPDNVTGSLYRTADRLALHCKTESRGQLLRLVDGHQRRQVRGPRATRPRARSKRRKTGAGKSAMGRRSAQMSGQRRDRIRWTHVIWIATIMLAVTWLLGSVLPVEPGGGNG